jgi:alpha-tubulin suppressor-like RCC1 family protein
LGTNLSLSAESEPDELLTESIYTWKSFSCGYFFTCGIETHGTLWCWGNNSHGELGYGFDAMYETTPMLVNFDIDWSFVSAGERFACALKTDGKMWCWGQNIYGQLGNGKSISTYYSPNNFNDYTWNALDLGERSACGIRSDNSLWCWGYNNEGQLGNPLFTQDRSRIHLEVIDDNVSGSQWTDIFAFHRFICGTRDDYSLWCWGSNDYYQLGAGELGQLSRSPVKVTDTASGSKWNRVVPGYIHTCGIRDDGTLWCWGHNKYGQLGIDPNILEKVNYPIKVEY